MKLFKEFYLTPAYANPTGWRIERTNRFSNFSTLYHELVCHVEHFSVELDTIHQHTT